MIAYKSEYLFIFMFALERSRFMAKKSLKPLKIPIQKRSRETVNIILKASVHILNKHGWDSFTTRNIADEAGISYGSLYQYFPNKDSILRSLTLSVLARDIEELQNLSLEFEITKNSKLILQQLVHQIVKWHQHDGPMRSLIYQKSNELKLGSDILKAQQMLIILFHQIVEKILNNIRTKNSSRGDVSRESIAVLFYAVLGVCHSMEVLEKVMPAKEIEQSLLKLISRFLGLDEVLIDEL